MVIIQGMEHLPKNCKECQFCYYDDEFMDYMCPWHDCDVNCYDEKRMENCPLIESEVDNNG